MSIQVTDNSAQIKGAMRQAAIRALEKCGLTAEGYAKMMCPVDTGNLRNSITHAIDPGEMAVLIGTNVQYAVYMEMGTGKYVSGGRPTPWVYQDAKGEWHKTEGNRAQPFIKPAVSGYAGKYRQIIHDEMKNG